MQVFGCYLWSVCFRKENLCYATGAKLNITWQILYNVIKCNKHVRQFQRYVFVINRCNFCNNVDKIM